MKRVVGETVITEEATKMNTTDVEREDPTTAEEEIGTDPTREEETGRERDPLRQSDIRRDHTEVEVEKKTDIRTVDDERGGIGSLRLNEEEDLIYTGIDHTEMEVGIETDIRRGVRGNPILNVEEDLIRRDHTEVETDIRLVGDKRE